MGGVPPTPQRHREDVLRHERPECRPGEDGGEHPREAHRDDVVGRQDQLGNDDHEERPMHEPCGDPPSGSAWDEHERDADQRDRERRDRQGRERVRSGVGEHRSRRGAASATWSARATTQSVTTNVVRNTTRCRKRPRTASARTVPHRRTMINGTAMRTSTAFATSTSVGVRRSAAASVTARSTPVTASVASPIARMTPRSTTPSRPHAHRCQPIPRTSGGGSPEGRRRRPAF